MKLRMRNIIAMMVYAILTVAQDRLITLAKIRNKKLSIHLFGQEVQHETYDICKSDILLKGDGDKLTILRMVSHCLQMVMQLINLILC